MALSKPTNGSNADYANRIGLLFDAFNNGNYAFPAVQVPSADANTLDDYEEGTWTPSLGGTTTYNTQLGFYTKIGRRVSLNVNLAVTLIGTGSTSTMTGAPFTSAITAAGHVGYFDNSNVTPVFMSCTLASGATSIVLTGLTAASANMTTPLAHFKNSAQVVLAMNYHV